MNKAYKESLRLMLVLFLAAWGRHTNTAATFLPKAMC